MYTERLAWLLAALTPQRLTETITALLDRQALNSRSGVAVSTIFGVLTESEDLGTGPERAQAYMKVKQAIMDTVARIPGMRYVEASA